MRNKMISLPEQLYNKLKEEKNASALISKLLDDYFFLPEDKIIEQVKEKIQEKDKLTVWLEGFRARFDNNEEKMIKFVEGSSMTLKNKFKQAMDMQK